MYKLLVISAFAFLALTVEVQAKDFYVAQAPAGSGSGLASCTDAAPVSWFNNPVNWGAAANQVGPGTTVHLCGTFTGTPGQQLLIAKGDGTSANPITIKFEPGANLTAPYWSVSGAIDVGNRSYITVDGGGTGIIQNTANGTNLAYREKSRAVYAASCIGCVVQNLTIVNMYVHTDVSDVIVGLQTAVNCVMFMDANGFTINNVTCRDAGWAFVGGGDDFTLKNSEVSRIDHGLGFGPRAMSSGIQIYGNHIHDYANWDNTLNEYHHDGIHIWGQNGGIVTNGSVYNNRFDGDSGVNITAHVYIQDSVRNVSVFNNVFSVPANRTNNALWFEGQTGTTLPGGPATGNSAYNNFINDGGHSVGVAMLIRDQFNFTAVNNILLGGAWDIAVVGGSLSPVGIDYNVYQDLLADSARATAFGLQGIPYRDLPAWQAACRCDSRSILVPASKINAGTSGQLLTGSVGIAAGSNLTSVSTGALTPLASDILGAARPAGGSWDAGAYQNGAVAAKPPAPAGLTAIVK
jgi:hypothetical protein